MKLSTLITSILFISSSILFSQSQENFKLSGCAADESTGKGLTGATVSVLQRETEKILTGTITDDKGYFSVDNIPFSIIRLKVSMMGYQTVVIDSMDLKETSNAGLIKLKSSAIIMPEIVIKSLKPMIEFHADKQVLNIDRLPGSSGSVTEALKNSGTVEVDPSTNKITVRGQSVKLQMDGHQYDMPNDMLAQMPASMLEQVEVILAPGAKESAEGGTYILNMITKKNMFDNISGSVSYNASTNNNNFGSANLNYKAGKLNVFSQAWGSYYEFLSTNENELFSYTSKSMYYQKQSGRGKNFQYSGYGKLGFDYDFDEKNSMTVYGTYNMNHFNSVSNSSNQVKNYEDILQYYYGRENNNEGLYSNMTFYGFYKKKFEAKGNELSFDAMLTLLDNPSDTKMHMDYSNRIGLPQLQNSHTGVDAGTLIFKADYVLPISTGKLETGYNFTYRTRKNDYDVEDFSYITYAWKDSMGLSNVFEYNETIHALYGSYSHKLGKFDFKGGIRMEDLITDGKQITTNVDFSENYLSFFPNVNVSYKFSDLFQLGFTAFRRVTYPPIYYLNPFRQYRGPNMYFAGNPRLGPYYVNSYAVNLSQYINVYYVASNGFFTPATATENDTVLVSSYLNLKDGKTYGVDLTFPYYNTPMAFFRLPEFINMINIRFNYLYREQAGQYLNEDLSLIDRNFNINANLGLKLWYDINANIYLYYRPKTETRLRVSTGTQYLSVYFSKSFLGNKLRFNLSVDDILNSQKYDNQSFGSNYYSKSSYVYQDGRSIRLGITYMFNDYKERRDRNLDDGRDRDAGGKGSN